MLHLTESDIEGMLSIEAAIPIIEDCFRSSGEGNAENPARFRMPIRKGFLQFGPAALHDRDVMGFKLWANFGSPLRQVWDFLYSMQTSELLAVIQAHTISKYRTSAVTAVATKYLSRPDAQIVGLYGSGRQAEAQIEAICQVRPIDRVQVYSPTKANREAFCAKMSERLKINVVPMDSPEDVPNQADIIVTMTKSETPVLHGSWLKGPALIIGAGGNHWFEQEIDGAVVEAASLVVVDEREQAKVEGGDILWAAGHGLITWDKVENLGHVIVGRVPVPDPANNTILFESHGCAMTDVAIAAAAYDIAVQRGLGRQLEL